MMESSNSLPSRDRDEFLRSSPLPPTKRTKNRLTELGNRNNAIAYQMLQGIHSLYANPQIWRDLSANTRSEMTALRGLGFDGLYPDVSDLTRIRQTINQESTACRTALATIECLEQIIATEEQRWQQTQELHGFGNELMHRLQDTVVGTRDLPQNHGKRVVTFGSARARKDSPTYEAARWVNETIVTGSLREDGTSETVLSGAGPGVMEAANLGAMQGRWNIFKQLDAKLQNNPSADQRIQIVNAIQNARAQVHSLGIRIQLPFEAHWNPHLQLNLTIRNFAPRKGGLIYTTRGSDNNHNSNHPAIFAMPGGIGSEDEIWEAACLIQCGKMPSLPILTIGAETSDKVMRALEQMQNWEAIDPTDVGIFTVCRDEVDAIEQYHNAHDIPMSEYTRKAVTDRRPVLNGGLH